MALQNFINSDLYRVWKHLEILEGTLGQLSFMVDNQYGGRVERKLEKDLVEDFLILSVFSRVIKQDASLLSIALGLRYPLKASFVNKLATILVESEEFESLGKEQFWDIQEQPDVIVKFSQVNEISKIRHLFKTLKISLRTYYQCGIFHPISIQNLKKGTLGFILKNLKFSDAGALFEFLQAFWALASHYHSTFDACLNEEPGWDFNSYGEIGSNASSEHFARIWLDGVQAALWAKRLGDMCAENCGSSLPDEKLMANMNLIVLWISEQAVPTLGNLKALTAQREMQTLVNNCFQTLNHCRDGILLGRNKIFRDSCTTRYLTGTHNPEAVEYLMQYVGFLTRTFLSAKHNFFIS